MLATAMSEMAQIILQAGISSGHPQEADIHGVGLLGITDTHPNGKLLPTGGAALGPPLTSL